ncbi:MAG: 1-deoxy-D-xylulose-5-phosphate synthase [Defluviitaleaceae bacterium]|nr:1-deoxy-D-xylulose-5-phosphate synthase [Defluviitaleaceae bacterium]MCL2224929.1 1-deoxy-D-xylulose-5-phosphate synthase [Defluviitaleaceae bacterium]MCL2262509.1 1-deoxy-D-xylulose-5-phosphate synthase [Defluviitaleaceae bacterium]
MKKDNLKRLSISALRSVAGDIREFLIKSISDTGGHLASNLGVVELTLALHTVFSTPYDKIIWDVGHQAYVHKILTGRKGRFGDLRKMDGLSGFPKPCESEHDAFGTGHSSTAISAALGLAIARDVEERDELMGITPPQEPHRKKAIIAVVGDGSLTGGLAYEGLNNAGRADTDLLVVLNDNQMSISKNVGAVARHLNSLRTAKAYLGAKEDVHFILDKLPVVGAPITRGIESAKDILKYAVLPGVLFEEMGFKYIGPVDGHDISALVTALRRVRKLRGPVLLHVVTTKGKGYDIAEEQPRSYHGVGKFDVETGLPEAEQGEPTFTDIFSKHLCEKAKSDSRIVAITAAMRDGVGLSRFKERFPKRFFDVGIAEAHAVTFAAGLAMGGMKPVVAVYSSFLQRAYDNIIHDVAIQNLPVIFAVDHGGAVAGDGETHQGIYDISFLSHIPNLTVLAPSCGSELKEMLDFALEQNGPVAIRYPKSPCKLDNSPLEKNSKKISFIQLQEGKKVAIVSVGVMLDTAQDVCEKLSQDGFSPALFSARVVKPVCEGLLAALSQYEYVFSLEDGARIGGFGERIGAAHAFAFPDVFPETGTRKQLFARYEMDAENIYKKIHEVLKNGQRKSKQKATEQAN